jgi:hypothetical protein
VDKWKGLIRYLRVKRSMLDCLIDAGYILNFNDEVLLVADWLRHNTIKMDRYSVSAYKRLLDTLDRLPNGRYFKASEVFLEPQYK